MGTVAEESYIETTKDAFSLKEMEFDLEYKAYSYNEGHRDIHETSDVHFKKTGTSTDSTIELKKTVYIGTAENLEATLKKQGDRYYSKKDGGELTESSKSEVETIANVAAEMYVPVDMNSGKLIDYTLLSDVDVYRQFHFTVTGTASNSSTEVSLTYNFVKKAIKGYERTIKTLDGDGYLVLEEHFVYSFK